jgi:hypothetical protein
MAARFCTQCGSEIAEGRRFCGRCGAAIAQRPQSVEVVSEPVKEVRAIKDTASSAPSKPHSQMPTVSGPVSSPVQEQPARPVISLPVKVEHPPGPSQVLQGEPQYPYATPTPSAVPATLGRGAPAETLQPANRRSPRLLAGIGLAVLVLAAGATGFYEWHKKSSEAVGGDTVAQTQSSPDTPQVAPNPEPVEKPDAGIITSPAPVVPTPSPKVEPDVPPLPASRPPVHEKTRPGPGEVPVPAPIIHKVPEPKSLTAGVLHYAGPPVHYGEAITFSGLPGAMLRFSFDHSSWQPRISHQPDGTQTLTLRSLTQQDQTQCEVRWEVAR